jgi:hypothetical protein
MVAVILDREQPLGVDMGIGVREQHPIDRRVRIDHGGAIGGDRWKDVRRIQVNCQQCSFRMGPVASFQSDVGDFRCW